MTTDRKRPSGQASPSAGGVDRTPNDLAAYGAEILRRGNRNWLLKVKGVDYGSMKSKRSAVEIGRGLMIFNL